MKLKNRHMFGLGAAACTLCCAVPLLALLGLAGTAASVLAFFLAGGVFALVVAAAAGVAAWRHHRGAHRLDRLGTTAPSE
jgi:predicted lysophospholipase L1 biosynthesis ABC-type transport system permease subunit